MPCHCRKFSPKGKKPGGGKSAPKVKTVPLNRGIAGSKIAGVKVPKVTPVKASPTKGKAPKVSKRVAYYQKREAAALKKANANPCKCTPGKP
jgi:hypothetical protein